MAENKTQDQTPSDDVQKLRTELEASRAETAEVRQALQKAEEEQKTAAQEVKTRRKTAAMQAAMEEKRAMHQLRQQEKVLLTINSYAYRINRDEPVLVPRAVAEALKLAIMEVPQVKREANGQERTVFRHVNRFSFSVETPTENDQAEDA